MKTLFTAIYQFIIPCPDSLGHRYGSHSDLCHNTGCNASAGSWKPCEGTLPDYERRIILP